MCDVVGWCRGATLRYPGGVSAGSDRRALSVEEAVARLREEAWGDPELWEVVESLTRLLRDGKIGAVLVDGVVRVFELKN